MTESEKRIITETKKTIEDSLDALQAMGFIGSWEFGFVAYKLPVVLDPNRKKNLVDYALAVFNLRRLTEAEKKYLKMGFTFLCYIQNPQNTHQIEILKKEYPTTVVYNQLLDGVKYDEIMFLMDQIARVLTVIDLRNYPENPHIDGSGNGKIITLVK